MSNAKRYQLSMTVKRKFADMAENNKLDGKTMADILRASSNDEFAKAVSKLYDLHEQKQMALWYYIITAVWKKEDKQTWFNESECFFIREMLMNRGVLKKTECMKIKALFTHHKTTVTANNLHEMGLINIFELNGEVLYALNRDFYDEALGNGTGK